MLLPISLPSSTSRLEKRESQPARTVSTPRAQATFGDSPESRAKVLLAKLVSELHENRPTLVNYGAAWAYVFNRSYDKFSQNYSREVIEVATGLEPIAIRGLGEVTLDTFIVALKDNATERTWFPGQGHFVLASYSAEQWLEIFGENERRIKGKDPQVLRQWLGQA